MNWYDNEPCEICQVQPIVQHDGVVAFDRSWRNENPHCRDLRRNREARKNKNIQPKVSVF